MEGRMPGNWVTWTLGLKKKWLPSALCYKTKTFHVPINKGVFLAIIMVAIQTIYRLSLSFFLSICLVATLLKKLWTDCEEIWWTVRGSKKNKWLNLGGDLDHHSECPIENPAITQQIVSGFDKIFRIDLQLYKEHLIKFWGDLDYYVDSPNRESG